MSGMKIQSRPMTIEEMEADAIAAELAEKAAAEAPSDVKPVVEEPTPEPVKEQSPAPEQPAADEVEPMKAVLAEKDARIAELTKRVRDEDGRRGGELNALRDQVGKLGDQLRDLMAENRSLRQAPPAAPVAPEPDPLETEYPEVAKGMDRRAKPAMDAATRAEQLAKEANESTQKLMANQRQRDYDAFLGKIKSSVTKMDDYNHDPEFLAWCKQRSSGTPFSRQYVLDECSISMNPEPVIEIFQQWEKEKTAVSAPEPEIPKGPAKPSKEAQSEVPRAAAPAAKVKVVNSAKRLREIEDKVFRFGTSTAEDRIEYNRLLDAQERGELT